MWDEDFPGFGLRVSASGRRTWILMCRMGKTLRRLTLGRYPTLGLADARVKATHALREVDRGEDPGRQKVEDRRAETFDEFDDGEETGATSPVRPRRSAACTSTCASVRKRPAGARRRPGPTSPPRKSTRF